MTRIVKRRRGDTLMPARFPQTVVAGLKAKAREWSGQYQQQPMPESGVIFNPAWWKFYKPEAAPEFELVVLSVDCAFKSGKEHDLVALQKWGMVGARSYLIEREADHLGYVATKAMIRAMQLHGRPASSILIEDRANGSAVVEELKSDPDFGAAVIPIDPQGDKKSRAFAASADVEAGSVYLPEGAPWLPEFLRTLSTFPASRYDDDVDACSQFLNWRRTRSLSLGLVDLFKRKAREIAEGLRDKFGDLIRKPEANRKPIETKSKMSGETRVEGFENWLTSGKAPPCPACGATTTVYLAGKKIHCNQCAADDGVQPARARSCNCGNFLPAYAGGRLRCNNCGWQESLPGDAVHGISRRDYDRYRRGRFG